jgi:hypothetical protein
VEPTTTSNAGYLQIVLLALLLIPAIFFLLTQFNTLRYIRPENRRMQPGWVWLQLIPFFGQIWQFVVVTRIAASIQNQWQVGDEDSILGIHAEAVAGNSGNKPTLGIGIAYCTLNALMIFCNLFFRAGPNTGVSLIVGSMAIASTICWIVYWVSLAGWKRRLKNRFRFTI